MYLKNKNKPRREKSRAPRAAKSAVQPKSTKPTKRPFNLWVYKYFDMTNVGDDKHKESL